MKRSVMGAGALACGIAAAGVASAGGVERSTQSVAILFKEGRYAEFGMSSA